jgi:predicted XRE-type DNA-binding protein
MSRNHEVETIDGDVLEHLGVPGGAEERTRVDMASALTIEIRRRKLTQRAAAELLGVSQPDVSAIMNARVDGFSQERLGRLLNRLDQDVRIQIGPRRNGKGEAGVTVELVAAF